MKNLKINLSKQLVIITILSFMIMIISLIIVLPISLEPFFEETVYNYLEQPLQVFEGTSNKNRKFRDIVYIQFDGSAAYITSNYKNILDIEDYTKILKYIDKGQGKFIYKGKKYYYYLKVRGTETKTIAITSDSYIKVLRANTLMIVLPIVITTFLIILILLLLWSRIVVKKLERLKLKVDNITDENFSVAENKYELDDELKLLDDTIDKMKDIILSEEKYKSEMYQNISHDFKTPIMVVKSYIEAYKDGIEDIDTVLTVSETQIEKLEKKVKTLLELNKITYLQNSYKNDKKIKIQTIINTTVDKYKIINKNLIYELKCDDENIEYNGTEDIWESIINNILSNFIRYAKTKIVITIKENKIVFYNDGEKIEKDILKDMFKPYNKGSKGENGLGLSIVKANVDLIGYKVVAKNTKEGVEFIINKNSK